MYGIPLLFVCALGFASGISPIIYFENDLPAITNKNIKTDEDLSSGITKLALEMDRIFTSMDPYENVVFSPLSIASVLALMLLGAEGYTAVELSQLLGVNHKVRMNLDYRLKLLHEQFGTILSNLEHKDGDGFELDTATGVFPQSNYHVKKDYLDRAENIYKSDVYPLDYATRNFDALAIINKWVANKTHDRITHLLSEPPSPDTAIIMASALYFNGNWKYPFLPVATRRAPFYVREKSGTSKEETVDVDLMVGSAEIQYLDDEKHGGQMIGLPYVGEQVYTYIILPNDNIRSFMKNFTEQDLHDMVKSAEKTTVIYALPKMNLDNDIDLTDTLRKVGLSVTFSPSQADFRNIADGGVVVDQVLHKVELEVNEVGTKASAATSGSTLKTGAIPVVRLDRPFLMFVYRKQTDTVLFWAKIMKPTPNYPTGSKKVKTVRRY